MSYTFNQDSKRKNIMTSMMGLMQDLQKLAPHPDQPQNNGPVFIKSNPNFKVANDHEGMLGSLIMETILGAAFSEAVSETIGSWAQDLDISNAMDCYSEYITDVEQSEDKIAANGQGTLARLSGKSIAPSFNMRSDISAPMQAFMDDMPERMTIERNLAYFAKELEMIDAQAPQYETSKPAIAA